MLYSILYYDFVGSHNSKNIKNIYSNSRISSTIKFYVTTFLAELPNGFRAQLTTTNSKFQKAEKSVLQYLHYQL